MAQSVKIIEKICQQKAENEHLIRHSHQKRKYGTNTIYAACKTNSNAMISIPEGALLHKAWVTVALGAFLDLRGCLSFKPFGLPRFLPWMTVLS